MKTCNKAKQRGDRHRTVSAFYEDCIGDNFTLSIEEAVRLTWKYQIKYVKLLESKTKNFGDDSCDIETQHYFYDEYIKNDYTITMYEAVEMTWDYLDKYIKLLEGRLRYYRGMV